ncbi:GyrI-like domain-containing protein [Jiulongibacter sp. NS-SX5]|uniref:GyrI-like domain-containing protein n=1 Tax=Jiulongibacter sp. NS-SX5 TaxID=3463854 RepID=UPI0040583570
MEARIISLDEKKMVGMMMPMTFQNHNPGALWGQFMPRRNEIKNRIGTDFYSLQKADEGMVMTDIIPSTTFEKWALVEVLDFENVPDRMQTFNLPSGDYAVFTHVGNTPQGFMESIGYILSQWLPKSGYVLDSRPHFEVLGAKYDRANPMSEEDIYIPIKKA